MVRKAVFDIAGICYSVEKVSNGVDLDIGPSHKHFLSDREPALRFEAVDGPWPVLEGMNKTFDSASWWSMFEAPGVRVVSFFGTTPPYEENRRAVMSMDYRSGTIYCKNIMEKAFPQSYPLEELIYINVLPSYNGVIIHSCGVITPEGGYLFVGVSGAGKSTITKIFQRETTHKVLSDDRIIIREMNGRFMMFGTPWHGEVDVCENLGVPLKKIFFIKHFPKNAAERLSLIPSTMTLLARSFPPFWNKEGMGKTTDLCAEIAGRIPCYEMGFVPDKSILPFLSTLGGD